MNNETIATRILTKQIVVSFDTIKNLRTIEQAKKLDDDRKSFDREKFDEIVRETQQTALDEMNRVRY